MVAVGVRDAVEVTVGGLNGVTAPQPIKTGSRRILQSKSALPRARKEKSRVTKVIEFSQVAKDGKPSWS